MKILRPNFVDRIGAKLGVSDSAYDARILGGKSFASMPSAVTIGNFDGVHLGHQRVMQRIVEVAKAQNLRSMVLTFEPHPQEYFRPNVPNPRIQTLRDRLQAIAETGVDEVILCRFNADFAALSAEMFIELVLVQTLNVRHLVVGDDFCFGANRLGNWEMLQQASLQHGFVLEAMPRVDLLGERVSSSRTRTNLQAGNLALVEKLLNRPYEISGHVIHGQKLGRQWGFPTLNIRFPYKHSALSGILVVRVHGLGAEPVFGVASLGVRPTLGENKPILLEVHLLDSQVNAYGKLVRVACLHKLHDEIHYESLDALRIGIASDVAAARAWLAAHY